MRLSDRAFVLLACAILVFAWQVSRPSGSEQRPPVLVVEPLTLPRVMRHATLIAGETLSQLLEHLGAAASEVPEWVGAARSQLDLRSLPVGLSVEADLDHHGNLDAVRLTPDWRETVVLQSGPGGVSARREARPVQRELWVVQGTVRSSLFEAVAAAGEDETLAVDLADLFQWDIDFHREVREGDTFQLVVERVLSDGRVVDHGPILAATYTNAGRRLTAVRYSPEGARPGYYDAQGHPLRKQFLRAPLRFTRITSRFSLSRLHPVLGRRMPHWGVDYGAPVGTPVMATADGVVVFRGRKGGGGNTVELRHPNGYVTGYLHLSRFARGLRVGSRVSQGEVVGYVGATGLATGPHLDYRVTHDGRHVNPLTLAHDPAPPLARSEMPRFAAWAGEVLPLLETPGALSAGAAGALQKGAPVRFDG